jgi:transcriptional regulator with XRE-family HTH domain
MAYRSINLVTGRQLRAARTLAGMTQRDLATVLAVNERAVRFWERKHDRRPTSASDTRIEQALLARGVILFARRVLGSPKSGNFAAFKGDLAIERRCGAEDQPEPFHARKHRGAPVRIFRIVRVCAEVQSRQWFRGLTAADGCQ